MGETGKDALRVGFDRSIKLEFHGARLSRLALPPSVKHWTLTTLRDKLIKIGGKMVRHARYVIFQLAEVAISRQLYRMILDRIRRFAVIEPRAVPI